MSERIWLQSDEEFGEVSWCSDKINDDDVGYVRADIYAQLEAENEELKVGLADSSAEIVLCHTEIESLRTRIKLGIAENETLVEMLADLAGELMDEDPRHAEINVLLAGEEG